MTQHNKYKKTKINDFEEVCFMLYKVTFSFVMSVSFIAARNLERITYLPLFIGKCIMIQQYYN